jgi:hypothetical protein
MSDVSFIGPIKSIWPQLVPSGPSVFYFKTSDGGIAVVDKSKRGDYQILRHPSGFVMSTRELGRRWGATKLLVWKR